MRLSSSRHTDITQGAIWKQLLIFFFPVVLGSFFQQLYNTVDAIIVGQHLGKEALTAVGGTTSYIVNILVNLFVGVASGTSVVVAQSFGAKNHQKVQETVHSSISLALLGGVIFFGIGYSIAPFMLRVLKVPNEVLGYASTYLRIYFFGMVPTCVYNVGAGILRGVGDTRRPLYFLLSACCVNIVLDLLFVVVLQMGIAGAALATIISQTLSCVLVLITLHSPDALYHLSFKKLQLQPQVLKNILRIGLPAGLQSDMFTIANMVILSRFNMLGTNAIAAWTAFSKVDMFFWMSSSALGISIATFVGQNFGAKKYDRIRKCVKIGLGMECGMSMLFGLIFALFAPFSISMFTTDATVIAMGSQIIYRLSTLYFLYTFVEVFSSTIRGSGIAFTPMLMVCCGVCIFRILWAFIVLPFNPTFETILLNYPITWIITSIMFVIYFFRSDWFKKCLLKAGHPLPDVPRLFG